LTMTMSETNKARIIAELLEKKEPSCSFYTFLRVLNELST